MTICASAGGTSGLSSWGGCTDPVELLLRHRAAVRAIQGVAAGEQQVGHEPKAVDV